MSEDFYAGPSINLKAPTFRPQNEDLEAGKGRTGSTHNKPSESIRSSHLRERNPKRLQLGSQIPDQDVYLGSYRPATPRIFNDGKPHQRSPGPSPRASTSHSLLEPLLQAVDTDLDTFGLEETRDGFFDAGFYRPLRVNHPEMMRRAALTLPPSCKTHHPLSVRYFASRQLSEAREFLRQSTTSRAGIRLWKSFLGVFLCYIVCLIPVSRDWLGRYNYVIVLSALINHPGRPIGSQIDGSLMTILGTLAGLGWGSLGLYVSTSTGVASSGYGGILALFLVLFAALMGWLRYVFIRFYQAVISASIAIIYTSLADTSETVSWKKIFNYGIPWVLGQAICGLVTLLVFPDSGSRSMGFAFCESLDVIHRALRLPRDFSAASNHELSQQIVDLSQAVRDFTIEITITPFRPNDVRELRDLLQSVMRSILSVKVDTTLFDQLMLSQDNVQASYSAKKLICDHLSQPTRSMIDAMMIATQNADKTLTHSIARRALFNVSAEASIMLSKTLLELRLAKKNFDLADVALTSHPDSSLTYSKHPDVVNLFLFIHPIRQTADKVEAFLQKVVEMDQTNTKWRIRAPSYPWYKAIMRANAQVRHDRGGLTAALYFSSKDNFDRAIHDVSYRSYIPTSQKEGATARPPDISAIGDDMVCEGRQGSWFAKARYELWTGMHRMQGFESRSALKTTLVTVLLSLPAWLPQSRDWWNENESWWVVVAAVLQMHPRVGGTLHDLFVRCLCVVLGAVWAALSHAAGNGNPYVVGVFAAVFLIPMLHRFTQSSHPRSGGIGCISFSIISLDIYTNGRQSAPGIIAWTRGMAFIIGVFAGLLVNGILWPFIARHELRKSISTMMLHQADLYRTVIAEYVYCSQGKPPSAELIEQSEMLEGHLREAFVRMRQLMEMTRHETRLRAPFDPLPFSGLISACEAFFAHVVRIRQSCLYFESSMLVSGPHAIAELALVRRDAVAAILMNLYTISCALRLDRPVPKYLPSAAAARRRLLDQMEMVEAKETSRLAAEISGKVPLDTAKAESKKKRWADVYHYAYSTALTDIIGELQEMQRYTKEICGEVAWE